MFKDANQVRNCQLVGLKDLNQGSEYVRGKIVELLNRLISYGVAGFRYIIRFKRLSKHCSVNKNISFSFDASKHMWPGDLQVISSRLNDLPTDKGFPAGTRPFIYQEVIDLGGEPIKGSEYVGIGRVTEFKYGKFLGEAFRGRNQLKWLVNFGMLCDTETVLFVSIDTT